MVLNLADSGPGSLRQAVGDANDLEGSDVIEFRRGLRGTIGLTGGELSITDDLTIDGPGARKLTISGNDASRIFNISGSETDLVVSDLTIADGLATGSEALGGGILNTGGLVTIIDVTFTNNQATGEGNLRAIAGGGAIANIFDATLTVSGSTFTGNQSFAPFRGVGGAILNDAGSTLTVVDGTFTGNQTTGLYEPTPSGTGGAGGAMANLGGSSALVSQSTFTGNQARGGDGSRGQPAGFGTGGAIENSGTSLVVANFGNLGGTTLIVEHSLFLNNEARGGAGADSLMGGGTGGGGFAGAIENWANGTVTIRDSEFRGNRAIAGRGGHSFSTAAGGKGGHAVGGAISNSSSTMTVERTTFIENQAISGSGGNSLAAGGTGELAQGGAYHHAEHGFSPMVTFTDVTLIGNQAIGGDGGDGGDGQGGNGGMGIGGGLELNGGTMHVIDSTLDGNVAIGGAGGSGATRGHGGAGFGGGIANANKGVEVAVLTVSGSLLKNNRAIGGFGTNGHVDGQCPNLLDDVSPCPGLAQGGGIFSGRRAVGGSTETTVTNTVIVNNQAIGGDGAWLGGDAQGGGIFNESGSTLTLLDSTITGNSAIGGDGDEEDGEGIGGGIYIEPGGTVSKDLLTLIDANFASTSDDDVFGLLSLI